MNRFHLYNQNVCTRLHLFGHDLGELLLDSGWQETTLEQAEFIFVNSCSFLKSREDFFLAQIAELEQAKAANQKLVVFGCLPHTSHDRLRQIYSGEIVTTRELTEFTRRFGLAPTTKNNIGYSLPRPVRPFDRLNFLLNRWLIRDPYLGYLSGEPAYYLNISRGCLGDCSYCSEKTSRGPLASRRIIDIRRAFAVGLDQGFRLFSLNADDVGVFGWDRGENIAQLLQELLAESGGYKFILTEFNPWGLIKHFRELLPLLASGKIAHITIPLQSGSDRILKLMKRPYASAEAVKLIKKIKQANPRMVINTHLIAGFPGETENDFALTLRLVRSGLFDKLKIFRYSERPGVASFTLPGKIPTKIIDERYRRLRREAIKQSLKKLSLRNLLLNLPLFSP